jgi:hypothetical protein
MISRVHPVAGGLCALVILAAPAPASSGEADLQKVKQLYDQLYFKEALILCDAIIDAGRNKREALLQLLLYRALIAASSGKEPLAVETFKRLLSIAPETTLDRAHAPRIRRAFAAARRWEARNKPLAVAVDAPKAASVRAPVAIRLVPTTDPLAVIQRATLYARVEGTSKFRYYPTESAKLEWRVAVPTTATSAHPWLEYYVAAQDRAFNDVVVIASAEEPRRIKLLDVPPPISALPPAPPPRRPRDRPLVQRWWLWTIVGAVVVGTAVGVGVGVGARRPGETVNAPITLEATK